MELLDIEAEMELKRRSLKDQVRYWIDKWTESHAEVARLRGVCKQADAELTAAGIERVKLQNEVARLTKKVKALQHQPTATTGKGE